MSVDNDTRTDGEQRPAPIVVAPRQRRRFGRTRRPRRSRPRVRKLRLLFVLTAFGALAVISTLFGALTSIASDLPRFENRIQFNRNLDSYMYDVNGSPIGPLAPASTPAIDNWDQISQQMVHAIVAVEDRGFWSESGISVRGLVRAAYADLTGGKLQGASTIPEEFIKNVRAEEGDRTVAEKLVEAGMAFQLSHHWSHERILTEYLNTIYFGNGALGIEAAARVYFGWDHGYNPSDPTGGRDDACGDANPEHPRRRECASVLKPAEAALLAAMVANPSAFNPAGTQAERAAAKARRNDVVLKDMYEQHYLSYTQYVAARDTPLPTRSEIRQPQQQPSAAPYFTSWVEPLVVRALEKEGLSPREAQYEAYYGGLKIKLSIDLKLQNEAQSVIDSELFSSPGLPSASLVAISNKTGEVRAMVSGDGDYAQLPFNLATMGYRQPGSSFKLFTLAAALARGRITPYTEFDSHQLTIHFVKKGGNAFAVANGTGQFPVHNFGNVYGGEIPMTVATATSDNSVFAQLGTDPKIGTAAVAHYAKLLGIRSPISRNPSMILGGLSTGVSALDMAHAYSTVANNGVKVTNPTLGDIGGGPIGIDKISNCDKCRHSTITNWGTMKTQPVLRPTVDATLTQLLHGPVDDSYGTGTAAAIPGVDVAGKTGTTSNYADAWFVGFTPQMTVAVWVGFPDGAKSMSDLYYGKPVEGGTFPAVIWHNYVTGALQILQDEAQHKQSAANTVTNQTPTYTGTTSATGTGTSTTSTQTTPTTDTTGQTNAASGQTTPGLSAPGSATTQTPTSGGSANQTETLPQSTAPTTPVGTSTAGSNGGSGL